MCVCVFRLSIGQARSDDEMSNSIVNLLMRRIWRKVMRLYYYESVISFFFFLKGETVLFLKGERIE